MVTSAAPSYVWAHFVHTHAHKLFPYLNFWMPVKPAKCELDLHFVFSGNICIGLLRVATGFLSLDLI